MSELPAHQTPARPTVRRWLPLALVVVLSVAAIAIGWNRKISFETLVHHNEAIHAFILGHRIAAVAIYVVAYVVTIALSLPGALILTLSGGFLFGGLVGAAAAGAGATIGATIIFMIAKSAFGEHLARRAGPLAEKLAQGFRAEAFHYLLFLRLVPLFPFFLVNLVPALAGVRAVDLRRGHRDRDHPGDLHVRLRRRRPRQRDPRAGRDLSCLPRVGPGRLPAGFRREGCGDAGTAGRAGGAGSGRADTGRGEADPRAARRQFIGVGTAEAEGRA